MNTTYTARRLYLIRVKGPFLQAPMPTYEQENDEKIVRMFRVALNVALSDYLGGVNFLEDTDDFDLDQEGPKCWEDWLKVNEYSFASLCNNAALDPQMVLDTFEKMKKDNPYATI